jgi:hypothetical protein
MNLDMGAVDVLKIVFQSIHDFLRTLSQNHR